MLDILYVAKGRRKFTEHTFDLLLQNTNWELANRLIVYDDGSAKADGSRRWLQRNISRCPQEHYFRETAFGSPVSVMNDYVDKSDAVWFCKIDNDICLPPGWLEAMVSVVDANPDLMILGMEAGMSGPPADGWDGVYTTNDDCSHIGGVGLIRREAFTRYPRPRPNGRFGWTESQHKYRRKSAWIKPDLRVCCLDQVPVEPWQVYSADYVKYGMQREWSQYPKEMADYYWSWML